MRLPRLLKRALAVLLPVAAGAGVAAWLVASQTPPPANPDPEAVRPVAVIAAPEVAWVPRAVGYGEARPAHTWPAVAEVSGRVVERNPELESGTILPEGTLLFQIDRTDYELAVNETRAAIAVLEARLRDLETRRANLGQSLAIERRRLEVAERELERKQTLLAKGTVPQSEVDREQRAYLQQRQAMQELDNALAQLPAERARLEAERAREQARLKQAQRNLPRTRITTPFALRVSQVNAEIGQYVRVGETLMSGDAVSATEVEAQVPIGAFRAILDPQRRPSSATGPTRLSEILPAMGLSAQARLRTTGGTETTAHWPARVDRIDAAIDPRTRTVGVVIVVDQPYEDARPPEKPPLVKGMYVEVQLCAPQRSPAVVVPRTAVHEGRVYVANADERLEIRDVALAYRYGDFAVVERGVVAGERVVVSDPVPAITGMKLAPQAARDTLDALITEASGTRGCP